MLEGVVSGEDCSMLVRWHFVAERAKLPRCFLPTTHKGITLLNKSLPKRSQILVPGVGDKVST